MIKLIETLCTYAQRFSKTQNSNVLFLGTEKSTLKEILYKNIQLYIALLQGKIYFMFQSKSQMNGSAQICRTEQIG